MSQVLDTDQMDFASQMCSRLCHDLISPVGAIANGLEILADEDDPDMQKQVIDLLNQSVQVTSAKLRFFRMAFGAPGGMEGNVDTREMRSAVSDFMQAGKTSLNWQISASQLPKPHAKLILIAAMICGDALVRGGEVALSGSAEGGFMIEGAGDKVVIDEQIVSLLDGAAVPTQHTSRYAPYILFVSLLKNLAIQHRLSVTDERIIVTIQP
ncbi:MAG: histidine phosphotransferase family protein [Pseudomonadota bacterium]